MNHKNLGKSSHALWDAPYHDVCIDGLRIAYRDCGDGPALVMLHGWPVYGDTFAPLVDALSATYRCIVPDLPGAGRTPWSTAHDLSPVGQSRLMQSFLATLGVTDYSLLGSDSGGMIARYLAAQDEPRVKKLVLLNTEIPGHRAPYQRLYKLLARWLPGYCSIAAFQLKFPTYLRSKQGFGGTLYDHRHLLGAFNARFIAPLTRSGQRMDNARRSLIALLNWKQLDALRFVHPQITADTLFIWGRQDNTFPESLGIEMSRDFKKRVRFISIDGAKLYVHEDQPDQVIHYVKCFMAADGPTVFDSSVEPTMVASPCCSTWNAHQS